MGEIAVARSPDAKHQEGALSGRCSGAPSAVLGLSGAGLTQGAGHGAAGGSADVLRKSPWRPQSPATTLPL